jgi:hypothetical protein
VVAEKSYLRYSRYLRPPIGLNLNDNGRFKFNFQFPPFFSSPARSSNMDPQQAVAIFESNPDVRDSICRYSPKGTFAVLKLEKTQTTISECPLKIGAIT